jgi:hypothetical protein
MIELLALVIGPFLLYHLVLRHSVSREYHWSQWLNKKRRGH